MPFHEEKRKTPEQDTQPWWLKEGTPTGRDIRFPWQTPAGVGMLWPWEEQRRTQEGKYIPEDFWQVRSPQQLQTQMSAKGIPSLPAPGQPSASMNRFGLPTGELGAAPTEKSLEDMMREAQVQAGRGWDMDFPEGVVEGKWITREDGSQGYWLRDPNSGVPLFQMVVSPTQQPVGFGAPEGDAPTDNYGRAAVWDADDSQWRYPPDWNVDPATLEAGYVSPQQQWERDWVEQQASREQEQWGQQQAWQREQAQMQFGLQRQAQLAQLRANPASWLEYASLSGEQPVVQPWMTGLGGGQAGQALPGWTAQGSLGGLPELTRPSRQYLARAGPVARGQHAGYEQARTGIPLEQLQWLQRSGGAPGGSFGGLRRIR